MANDKLISEITANLAAVLTRTCNDNPDAVRAISQLWDLSHVLERRFKERSITLADLCERSERLYYDSLPTVQND